MMKGNGIFELRMDPSRNPRGNISPASSSCDASRIHADSSLLCARPNRFKRIPRRWRSILPALFYGATVKDVVQSGFTDLPSVWRPKVVGRSRLCR